MWVVGTTGQLMAMAARAMAGDGALLCRVKFLRRPPRQAVRLSRITRTCGSLAGLDRNRLHGVSFKGP